MQRPWLAHYPAGVPAEIGHDYPRTLAQLIEEALERYAERTAVTFLGGHITYRQLDHASRAASAWLVQQGLSPGSRVALMMPNVPQYLACLLATLRAGHVVVNVNPLYTARELAAQLADSGAEVIFILESFAHTLEAALPHCSVRRVVLVTMGDMLGPVRATVFNGIIRHVRKMVPAYRLPGAVKFSDIARTAGSGTPNTSLNLTQTTPVPDDLAFLQYTGGTTGMPKAAMLTHGNLAANVEQVRAWFEPRLQTASGPQRVILSALPLYHVFSLTCSLCALRTGMCNVLVPNARDLPALVRTWRRHPPDIFPSVNTLFNALLNHPGFDQLDFSRLGITVGGGMAVQETVAARWKQVTGCHILESYGLSETSPGATVNPVSATDFTGSVGLPLPSTEISILDDDGRPLPSGETGEIAIRGPQVMIGYWNRPAETREVMTADGFLRTGDIGCMDDDGYVHLIDRKKDVIVVSGFKVYPSEVEEVAMQHPGVMEAAAIGVPDPHSGETFKLFIVRKHRHVSEEDIRRHCQHELTRYKVPRYIEFRDELPKSNVGKILRRVLREEQARSGAHHESSHPVPAHQQPHE